MKWYADEYDYLTDDERIKTAIEMKAPIILKGNILVNEDKTEYTILKKGEKETHNFRRKP